MKTLKIITNLLFAVCFSMVLTTITQVNPFWFIGSLTVIQAVTPFLQMPAGILSFNFTNLTWSDSLENMGGFTTIAYFAALQDIATFPTLVQNPTTDEEMVKLQGHYVMQSAKFFISVYCTPETVALAANNQGETDGQSFRLEGEFFYPGTAQDCRAFARKINNSRGVLILVDPDGERVVVGTEKFPCFFKPNINWGKAAADRKGMTVSFYQNHFAPGLIYNGSIPLIGSLVPAIS